MREAKQQAQGWATEAGGIGCLSRWIDGPRSGEGVESGAKSDPSSDTYEDSFASTKHTYVSRDADDTAEAINDNTKPVKSIDEEDEIETMQELDNIIDIFPEKTNNEGLRSAPEEANDDSFMRSKSRPKRQNSGTGIDRLVMSFNGKTYKSGKQFFMREQE